MLCSHKQQQQQQWLSSAIATISKFQQQLKQQLDHNAQVPQRKFILLFDFIQ
jgi:Lon protease-like protein